MPCKALAAVSLGVNDSASSCACASDPSLENLQARAEVVVSGGLGVLQLERYGVSSNEILCVCVSAYMCVSAYVCVSMSAKGVAEWFSHIEQVHDSVHTHKPLCHAIVDCDTEHAIT